MKKVLCVGLAVTVIASCLCLLSGCNMQVVDTTWKFDRAIIKLPNGEIIDGKVESWTDFDEGVQIQVKIDGKTYVTHAENVVLISG